MNKVDEWTVRMGDIAKAIEEDRLKRRDVLGWEQGYKCGKAECSVRLDLEREKVESAQQEMGEQMELNDRLRSELASEKDWCQHLRIQLAAEVEKVNKLQEQRTAEQEEFQRQLNAYKELYAPMAQQLVTERERLEGTYWQHTDELRKQLSAESKTP